MMELFDIQHVGTRTLLWIFQQKQFKELFTLRLQLSTDKESMSANWISLIKFFKVNLIIQLVPPERSTNTPKQPSD